MDEFDYLKESRPNRKLTARLLDAVRNLSAALWNILTVLALVGTATIVAFFWILYNNPRSALNPFPPPTLPPRLALPTATATFSIVLPATWTPTLTLEPTATETPRPTATLQPTPTFFTIATPTPTLIPTKPPAGYAFKVQEGGLVAIANIYHPELGCNWMGVGGQVLDLSGDPLWGLIIHLGGDLPGVKVPEHLTSLTGVALNYGRSGFEFTLADRPIASKGTLWIQLLDQSNIPLSEKVYFDTYESCEKNLIFITFKQVK